MSNPENLNMGKCPRCRVKIADVRPILNTPCPLCGSPVKQSHLTLTEGQLANGRVTA
jgi:hypothetical protein